MSKLHFKYATMNSWKTIDLMRTAYNYEENGYKVLIIKPIVDNKYTYMVLPVRLKE